jgi:hypothetical protein
MINMFEVELAERLLKFHDLILPSHEGGDL